MRRLLSKILPQDVKNYFHKLEAIWAAFVCGNPARKIKVIGVTGTKGKTTVVNMIASILDASGVKNAMLSTINIKIDNEIKPRRNKSLWITTPPAMIIHRFMKKAVKAGCEYMIIETSSQAIDQNNLFGIKFDTLVFTNLSHDHLDYHNTKESYLSAKLKLFKENPEAKFVINADDPQWNKFYSLPASEKFLFSVKRPVDHGITARKILSSLAGSTFTAVYDDGQTILNLGLPGIFNVKNALAAFAAGLALEVKPETIKSGLESIEQIAGRMEAIKLSKEQDFTVIIDYAHNPDSLKNVYETIRDSFNKGSGRLIAVLGATGFRDKSKRPLMGALAGHFADLVYFTNEDPYGEDPETIINEIAAGIFRGSKKRQWRLNRNYWKVLDRTQAIHHAITEAKKNDVVVITGKGAEEVMAIGQNEYIPFSDREVARNELIMRFRSH